MSKKDIEIAVEDTQNGTELFVGKKSIGSVVETESGFEAYSAQKLLASFKTYADAEEEVIRNYNLTI
ncbi:MAG: DUF2969 domain-containing protein [Streptococcaceae bacterium]|jgi:hypothetical protein|nr:DUF2969 domain-containing protein [Streptococcaceae bacterium]